MSRIAVARSSFSAATIFDISAEVVEAIVNYLIEDDKLQEQGLFEIKKRTEKVQVAALVQIWTGQATVRIDSSVSAKEASQGLIHYLQNTVSPILSKEIVVAECSSKNNFLENADAASIVESLTSNVILENDKEIIKIIQQIWKLICCTSDYANVNATSPSSLAGLFAPALFQCDAFDSDLPILTKAVEILARYRAMVLDILTVDQKQGEDLFLTKKDWEKLLSQAELQYYKKDEVILEDGATNYYTFMIKAGSASVLKGDITLSKLEQPAFFGDMSCLGTNITSAKVVALTDDTQIYKVDIAFLHKLFGSEPGIFIRFYWTLARKLCAFLHPRLGVDALPFTTITPAKRIEVVSVHFSDKEEQFYSFSSDKFTFGDLITLIHSKHPQRKELEYCKMFLHNIKQNSASTIQDKVAVIKYVDYASYTIYFTPVKPSTAKIKLQRKITLSGGVTEDVILHDFPCKLSNKNGTLFISKLKLTHYCRVFGFEKVTTIVINAITNSYIQNDTWVVVTDSKTYKLKLADAATCDTVDAVVTNLIKNAEGAVKQNGLGMRARAINLHRNNSSKSWLSLKPNDQVVVTSKTSDNFWICQKDGKMGKVQPKCIELIYDTTQKMKDVGYSNVADLPTQRDWTQVIGIASLRKFKAREVILQQGSTRQCMYQLISGTCKVEVAQQNGESIVVGAINEDETFGEISYLYGGGATASVVVSSKDAEAYEIDGNNLRRLFIKNPLLAGRFYKYLAIMLDQRIRAKNISVSNVDTFSEQEAPANANLVKMRITADYSGESYAYQISAKKGDIVIIHEKAEFRSVAENNGEMGWIPNEFLEPI